MKYIDIGLLQEPEVGAIVAVGIKDFFSVQICDLHFRALDILGVEKLKYITLLRYEGNGEFTEFYTGQIVHFAPIVDIESAYPEFVLNNAFSNRLAANLNPVQFYQKYQNLLINPLLIGNFEADLDDEIVKKIGEQEISKERIQELINSMISSERVDLENAYHLRNHEDTCLAYGENIIRDFSKGIVRSRTLEKKEVPKEESAE